MSRTLVYDPQLLFGYALASALRRHGHPRCHAVPDGDVLECELARGDVGRAILSLRADAVDAHDAVRRARVLAPGTQLVCLVAGSAATVAHAALHAGADEVVLRTWFLRRVQAGPSALSALETRGSPAGMVTHRDNAALVRATIAGSSSAWEALVDRHHHLLLTIARSSLLSDEDCADVVQTTWLRLLEQIDRIEDPRRVGRWLARTAETESRRARERRRLVAHAGEDVALEACAG